MTKIYVVGLEKIESRYTWHWHDHVPNLLDTGKYEIIRIEGDSIPPTTTPGAFIDFGATNIFKSSQLMTIAELFRQNKINDDDRFLYTDAWNPTILQLKYMADLLGKKIEIHGMWHASSNDPHDFLGRIKGNTEWLKNLEKSLYDAIDYNWYATNFSKTLLNPYRNAKLSIFDWYRYDMKSKLTGWPMEYLEKMVPKNKKKLNRIIFPHRIAPEKNLHIFEALKEKLPQYEFLVCQDKKLTKKEYHILMAESKICFSASDQETYGIAMCCEAPLMGVFPLAPNRLSYAEIFKNDLDFLYEDGLEKTNLDALSRKITNIMEMDDKLREEKIQSFMNNNYKKYAHADNLVNFILRS